MNLSGVAVVLIFASFPLTSSFADAQEDYALGPGDHVQVRVSDFRSGIGEAYQWTVYQAGSTAEFIVAPNGHLSLPVLGELEAAGKTTADMEDAIATKLQAKAALTTRPDASVQIVRFRPFYVVGGVDKPGEYEYRPGLTVLQAVGIAGGLERATTDQLLGFEKDALTSRGDLRVLYADRISLLARQARLDADIGDKAELVFPEELQAKASDPDVSRVMREEQLLFEARRTGLADQVNALEKNKTYLSNEITVLQQKSVTIDKQLAAMRKELDLINGLLTKGLTGAPRVLELQQSIAQIENNQLDVEVAIVRANEDISKSDRDIFDLKTKYQTDMLQEAADVRVKLSETIEKLQTSQALIQQAEVRAPALTLSNVVGYEKPSYVVSRRGKDGTPEDLTVQEADLVRPGDVVRVIPKSLDGAAPGVLGVAN
jgi:polysaccharide biosynthesis/export protein ExoF